MLLTSKLSLLLFIANLVSLFSCTTYTTTHNELGVELAMKQYDRLILKLDADSISMLFTPDGNLGDKIFGRDSIKKFLSSFKNVRVLSQSSATESIKINGDTAIQKGTYHQTDLISEKDTIKVSGEYTANWQWIPQKGWYIKRMTTKPAS